jgi:energy-coupling factor transporter ATP-binding protein EcfA2
MSTLPQYAKLIESLSKDQFDDLVSSFIESYWELEMVVLVDGKGDGGIDLKVFQNKSHLKLPIQVTIEKKPLEKLKKDLPKISKLIANYSYSNEFYFFSSHSISESKLNEVVESARTQLGITLNFMDAKFISSVILEPRFRKTLAILRKHFASLFHSKEAIFTNVEKLKFDLIIYGNQATEIKNKILDSFVLIQIFNNGSSIEIRSLEKLIKEKFNVTYEANLCERELNKLRQQQKVYFSGHLNSIVNLQLDERNRIEALLENLDISEAELIEIVKSILEKYGLEQQYKETIRHIYDIFRDVHNKDILEISGKSDLTSESKSLGRIVGYFKNATGDEKIATSIVKELIRSCSENDLIQRVSAGELFSKLVTEPEFETYLNISKRVVYLDTSIALHFLCALYFKRSKSKSIYYKTAVDLIAYSDHTLGRLDFKISDYYVYEIAYHVKEALRVLEFYKYDFFIKLGRSNNVFLNFFEELLSLGELGEGVESFRHFLQDFGFKVEGIAEEKQLKYVYEVLIRIFEANNFQVIKFEDYGITNKPTYNELKKSVEIELLNRNDLRHPEIIRRDTLMCAYLFDKAKHDNVDPIFITWDSIYYNVRKEYHKDHPNASFWHLFRPTKFLDHMSLLSLTINSKNISQDLLSIIEIDFGLSKKVSRLKDVFLKILDLKSETGVKLGQAISKLQADEIYKLKETATDPDYQENTAVEIFISKLYDHYKNNRGPYGLEDLKDCTTSPTNLEMLVVYLKKEVTTFQNTRKWSKSICTNLDYIIGLHKKNQLPC